MSDFQNRLAAVHTFVVQMRTNLGNFSDRLSLLEQQNAQLKTDIADAKLRAKVGETYLVLGEVVKLFVQVIEQRIGTPVRLSTLDVVYAYWKTIEGGDELERDAHCSLVIKYTQQLQNELEGRQSASSGKQDDKVKRDDVITSFRKLMPRTTSEQHDVALKRLVDLKIVLRNGAFPELVKLVDRLGSRGFDVLRSSNSTAPTALTGTGKLVSLHMLARKINNSRNTMAHFLRPSTRDTLTKTRLSADVRSISSEWDARNARTPDEPVLEQTDSEPVLKLIDALACDNEYLRDNEQLLARDNLVTCFTD